MVIGQFSMILVHILSLYRVQFKSQFFNYFNITFKLIPWSAFAALSWHKDHINYPGLWCDYDNETLVLLTDCFCLSFFALTVLFFRPGRFLPVHAKCPLTGHKGKNMVYKGEMRIFVIQLINIHSRNCVLQTSVPWTVMHYSCILCIASCYLMFLYLAL